MDPKQLADYYNETKRAQAAAEAAQRSEADETRAKMQAEADKVSRTLQSVVMPYLDKVGADIPDFHFDCQRDASSMKPVSLTMGLKSSGIVVKIRRQGMEMQCVASSLGVPSPCNAGNNIRTADDLTVEKIGSVVMWMLEQHRRHTGLLR